MEIQRTVQQQRQAVEDLKSVLMSPTSTQDERQLAATKLQKFAACVKRCTEAGEPADADWVVVLATFEMERTLPATPPDVPSVDGKPIGGK